MQPDKMHKKNKTIFALLWMILSTGLGKFASLIAQVVLGWILSKDDFGLYALAVSISSSVALLRNGGAQQILIQRGDEYDKLSPVIIKFSFIFNLLACAILLTAAPLAASLYQAEELTIMIGIIGISIPISTVNSIFRSKLLIDHDFKAVSIIDLSSNVVRQGSTIGFALMKFGYMSFIWPILLEVIFTAIISYYFVREMPSGTKLTWLYFKGLFKESKWIMLGSLAAALGYSGQYFVIGIFENTTQLGIYFFGFQLVTSVSVIFTYAIETVFFPLLSSMKNEHGALNKAYIKTISTIFIISTPICIIASLLTNNIVTLLWHDKWHDAVVIVEYLVFTIPSLLIISINRSILEAKGLWGQRLIVLGFYVVGDMFVAGVAAWQADIYLVAIATCVYKNISAIIQCFHVSYNIKSSMNRLVNAIFPSLFFGAIAYLLSVYGNLMITESGVIKINNIYVTCIIIFVIFMLLQVVFEGNKLRQLMGNS